MTKGPVTIKDIAKLLKLSKSTVSRALSEHADVNQETRQRVMETARKLNYQPNVIALHLKQQRTQTIGVIIPETVNRFFAKAIGGIQRVANLSGYNVMICQSDESYVAEKNNLRSLIASRVDGILISVSDETDRTDHFTDLINQNIPTVFFDRICEELDTSKVYTDNYEIAFTATEHLIQQDSKRIAIVAGPQNLYNSRNRLRGYVDALNKHNIPVKENLIIHSHFRNENIEDYTRHLINMNQRPDAVFAINDYSAVEMMHMFKMQGIRVPQDIAVLGFNNENIGRFVEPTLSTIDMPAYDMGAAAAEILLSQIKDPTLEPQQRLIKSNLVVRESSHRVPLRKAIV